MGADRAIQQGEQVLHSYGDLSDAQLLQTYGFVEEWPEGEFTNPHNYALLGWDTLVEACRAVLDGSGEVCAATGAGKGGSGEACAATGAGKGGSGEVCAANGAGKERAHSMRHGERAGDLHKGASEGSHACVRRRSLPHMAALSPYAGGSISARIAAGDGAFQAVVPFGSKHVSVQEPFDSLASLHDMPSPSPWLQSPPAVP